MLSIIGCGNVNRKDDGVGIAVVQQLLTFRSKWAKRVVELIGERVETYLNA